MLKDEASTTYARSFEHVHWNHQSSRSYSDRPSPMVNRNSRRPRHSYPLLFSFPLFLFTLLFFHRDSLVPSPRIFHHSFLSCTYVVCSVLYSLCKILLDLFFFFSFLFSPFSSDSIVPLIPSTSFSLSFLVFRPSVYLDAPPLC